MPALNEVMTGLQAGTITVKGRGNRVAIAFRREHSLWLRRRGDVPV